MLRPLALGLVLGSLAALPARADLSYSYVEGSAFKNSTDTAVGGNLDGTGAEGWFSYGVLKLLHVFGGTKYYDFDDYNASVTLVEAGAGVNYDPSPLTSIYFDLAAVTSTADKLTPTGPTVGVDDSGYTYLFGWREANKTGRMEFNLSAQHIEYQNVNAADTWVNMGLLFKITPRFKLTTAVQFAGDENLFKVGVRYYLPNRFDKKRD
jgi:hypothetical protein